jgi:hypothetical protein
MQGRNNYLHFTKELKVLACILLGSIKNEMLGSINEFKTREKRFFPGQRKGKANAIILFAKSSLCLEHQKHFVMAKHACLKQEHHEFRF